MTAEAMMMSFLPHTAPVSMTMTQAMTATYSRSRFPLVLRAFVRPVLTKGEAKKARILLSQNIEELSDMRVPDFVGQDDGSLRPTLIVAFFEDRMVGAALVGPVGNYAVAFEQNIRAFHPWCDARKASEILRKSVAEVQGLVVDSLHQGKGIGLRRIPDGRVLVTLKLFVISRSHLSVVGL